jgi:hypothetical protein
MSTQNAVAELSSANMQSLSIPNVDALRPNSQKQSLDETEYDGIDSHAAIDTHTSDHDLPSSYEIGIRGRR